MVMPRLKTVSRAAIVSTVVSLAVSYSRFVQGSSSQGLENRLGRGCVVQYATLEGKVYINGNGIAIGNKPSYKPYYMLTMCYDAIR